MKNYVFVENIHWLSNWSKKALEEILQKIEKSTKNKVNKNLTSKLTRKHLGFIYSGSKNGESFLHWEKPTPDYPKLPKYYLKITITNKIKFTFFILKYNLMYNNDYLEEDLLFSKNYIDPNE